MRSKMSAFNPALFRKTVKRFWPIWFIYFAVWFVILPVGLSSWRYTSSLSVKANILDLASTGGVIIGMLAAVAAAMAVWSFMYSSRSASATACLPIRREGVFLSLTLAGIVPLLCANVLIALIALGFEFIWGIASPGPLLTWLAVVSMELVFFYGFAVLCAQLTGNLIVLPLVYLVLNFTAYVVENLVRYLLDIFVYGATVYDGNTALMFLSPPVMLAAKVTRETQFDSEYSIVGHYMEGLDVAGIYAAVGVLLLLAALALYRRRRMETAGDVVAVGILRPVFKYCMTFGCAICFAFLIYSITGAGSAGLGGMLAMLALMLVGAFIGYFAAEMLIEKSFRVWRGRWRGIVVSALVIAALMFSMEFDLFGYERYVPETEDVAGVTLICYGETAKLYQEENIAEVTELHRSIIENKAWHEAGCSDEEDGYYDESDDGRTVNLRLSYLLKNGRSVEREYTLYWVKGEADTYGDTQTLQDLLNSTEAIASRNELQFDITEDTILSSYISASVPVELADSIPEDAEIGGIYDSDGTYITVYGSLEDLGEGCVVNYALDLTAEEAAGLYNDCIAPDMANGTLGQLYIIQDEEYEETVYAQQIYIEAVLYYSGGSGDYMYEDFCTTLTTSSARANAWLEAHGVTLVTIGETNYD